MKCPRTDLDKTLLYRLKLTINISKSMEISRTDVDKTAPYTVY